MKCRNAAMWLAGASLAIAPPAPARAQEAMAELFVAATTGDELAPLEGRRWRVLLGRLAVSGWFADGNRTREDRPCGGFVMDPEPCSRQLVAQDAAARGIALGLVASRERGRNRLLHTPYVGVTFLEHEQVGVISGARNSGDGGGVLFGYSVIGQHRVVGELRVGAGVDAALILPVNPACEDCYTPFEDGIATFGASVVASWRFH